MRLIFATNNRHKLKEIRASISSKYEISGLKEAGIFEELPETQETIEGNAIQKANFIFNNYSISCFADDTGLEVRALDNKPGVLSARYAGENGNSAKNIEKLLLELNNCDNRFAQFRTIIAYNNGGILTSFEGKIEGTIAYQERGNNGFGYDPIFIPSGYSETFAEMSLAEKNNISHRSKALQKFVAYLNNTKKV